MKPPWYSTPTWYFLFVNSLQNEFSKFCSYFDFGIFWEWKGQNVYDGDFILEVRDMMWSAGTSQFDLNWRMYSKLIINEYSSYH